MKKPTNVFLAADYDEAAEIAIAAIAVEETAWAIAEEAKWNI